MDRDAASSSEESEAKKATLIFAVAGGIASGKSTVARWLAELGGEIVDADALGHQILENDSVLRNRLVASFGRIIVDETNRIDRRALGEIVFNDSASLRRLNSLIHPEIVRALWKRVSDLEGAGASLVIIDAALFFDFEPTHEVDLTILTVAPRDVRRARLISRDGLSADDADRRLDSQSRIDAWKERADFVLRTDVTMSRVRENLLAEVERRFPGLAPPSPSSA